MDSLTQMALGAGVAYALGHRRWGKKAMVRGAIAGTVPDVDVFIGPSIYQDPLLAEMFHRSITHSLLAPVVAAGVRLLGAESMHRFFPGSRPDTNSKWYKRISIQQAHIIFRVWLTHIIIDLATNYGTQIALPFSAQWYTTAHIAIVDPLYTFPLLIGLIRAWRSSSSSAWKKNIWGLAVSSVYFIGMFGIKHYVHNNFSHIRKQYASGAVAVQETMPELPGPLLWRSVALDDENLYQGYYSVLAGEYRYGSVPHNKELLEPYRDLPKVQRVLERMGDMYIVSSPDDDTLLISHVLMAGFAGVEKTDEVPVFLGYVLNTTTQDIQPYDRRYSITQGRDSYRDATWGQPPVLQQDKININSTNIDEVSFIQH